MEGVLPEGRRALWVRPRCDMALTTRLCGVCFGSQQNRTALPTRIRHGRKQGNGGTHEAAEAINSCGLFGAAGVKNPAAFF